MILSVRAATSGTFDGVDTLLTYQLFRVILAQNVVGLPGEFAWHLQPNPPNALEYSQLALMVCSSAMKAGTPSESSLARAICAS
jgi:hypothetical protein